MRKSQRWEAGIQVPSPQRKPGSKASHRPIGGSRHSRLAGQTVAGQRAPLRGVPRAAGEERMVPQDRSAGGGKGGAAVESLVNAEGSTVC